MKKQAEETLATTTKAYKQQVDALTEKIGSDDQQQREMGARIQQLMQEIKAEKDMSKVASRKITELTDTVDSLNKARYGVGFLCVCSPLPAWVVVTGCRRKQNTG
jgi:chromosome segregation ATPase